jgi:CheY-like chemotaxis protein
MSNQIVLIVEDNPGNSELLAFILSSAGYEVRTAIDAEDALMALQSFQPDLILMDIGLPGVDGLELTRQLKSKPTTRDIPILAVSAYAMKGDAERGREAGCDGYITKPVDVRALPQIVANYLGSRTQTPPVA